MVVALLCGKVWLVIEVVVMVTYSLLSVVLLSLSSFCRDVVSFCWFVDVVLFFVCVVLVVLMCCCLC